MNDFFALLGINLVLCAIAARLLSRHGAARTWVRWCIAAVFVVFWLPSGAAHIPLAAYVRGVTSDLSVTLVLLAGAGLYQRLSGAALVSSRARTAVFVAVVVAAVFLYPSALGWGDHDAYRPGWGSPAMLGGLLLLCIAGWLMKFRVLALIAAAGLFAWAGGLMESGNLWDYLIDPWLAATAFVHLVCAGVRRLLDRKVLNQRSALH